MIGLNRHSGSGISGVAHLQQSISDILSTPIGSRVMRRDYGSRLFELIDQPANEAGRLRLMAATTDALIRWEPRLKLNSVTVDTQFNGQTTLHINGLYNGADTSLDVPLGAAL